MLGMQVISAAGSEWIAQFTGLEPRQFRKLVGVVARRGGEAIADGRPGRQWRAATGGPGVVGGGVLANKSDDAQERSAVRYLALGRAPGRRQLGPLLALAPVRKRRIEEVAIVDRTLVPAKDRRLAAPLKNDRYSANLQVAIDAKPRLVVATGDPQPGNRNDCTVCRDRSETGRQSSPSTPNHKPHAPNKNQLRNSI